MDSSRLPPGRGAAANPRRSATDPNKGRLDTPRYVTIISSYMMKKSSALDELLSSSCRADLVRWVAAAQPTDFTVAGAAKLLERKRTSLTPEVQRLERLGVISSRVIGNQRVYSTAPGPRIEALRSVVREFESGQLVLFAGG